MTAADKIARIRLELDDLEREIDGESLDAAGGDDMPGLDAWIERNRDALNASMERGDEAIARGDYFTGTADELFDLILERARKKAGKG